MKYPTTHRRVMNSGQSICRFCSKNCAKKHPFSLFSSQNRREDLPDRLSKLLPVPVARNDDLSQYICRTCKSNAVNIEQKMQEMRERARLSCQSSITDSLPSTSDKATNPMLHAHLQTRKRAKNSSSSTGISPFTQQSRPQSKRPYAMSMTSRRLFATDIMCK